MIQLKRPRTVPPNLKKLGEQQTNVDCTEYDACPKAYRGGTKRFKEWKDYYKAPPVKKVLIKMHRSKCCYCERLFRDPGELHVEHFRPKGGFRQDLDQKHDELPGYYWLAYKWDNLFLSCFRCNLTKSTRFPLADPAQRARSHHDEVEKEHPHFIDPAKDDPRSHIRFDEDLPVGRTKEGRDSIEGLGLRRPELEVDRSILLGEIRTRAEILDLAASSLSWAGLQTAASKARKYIDEAKRPEAEFSSMVIDFTASLGI